MLRVPGAGAPGGREYERIRGNEMSHSDKGRRKNPPLGRVILTDILVGVLILAVFMLWTATAYLVRRFDSPDQLPAARKPYYLITLIPALFMTSVCVSFILVDKIGFRLPLTWAPWIGLGTFVLSTLLFYYVKNKKLF